MTGSLISDDMKRTIEEGASLFIEKPFDIPQIKPFVKQVSERTLSVQRVIKQF
jgi:FixJ family two-component response regulator